MPNSQQNILESASSARELRQAIKKTQSNDAYLRVYQLLGQQLFDQGWSEQTASLLLTEICTLFAAEHGLIASEDSGKLTVISNRGRALPIGARIPMMGILANMLKNPVRFSLQQGRGGSLWTHVEAAEQPECIIPLGLQQHSLGIIALAGKHLNPNAADISAMQALAGLIGMAMHQPKSGEQPNIDRSILDQLTPRERELFALLPMGLSNVELGEKLGIASGTAKIHVERILNKLNLKDRTQAAVKAVELGYKSNQ
jgi:DNA-binding CsgD family transcriptional regulator